MNYHVLDRDKKIIIFWTPKCGCTTISNFVLEYRKLPLGTKKNSKIGFKCLLKKERIHKFRKWKKIIVVRNPYHRIVSCFVNKFVMYGRTRPKRPVFQRSIIEKYPEMFYSGKNYVGITFNEFIKLFEKEYQNDHHWNLQNKFGNIIKYDHIIHLENINEELKACLENLGITNIPPIGRFNVSIERSDDDIKESSSKNDDPNTKNGNIKQNMHIISKMEENFVNLSDTKSTLIKDYIVNIEYLSVNNFLTKENMEIIYKIYRPDFELGNYSYYL